MAGRTGRGHFARRGREVLRHVIMDAVPEPSMRAIRGGPSHWKIIRKALAQAGNHNGMRKAPFHGFQLTPLARSLEGEIRTCREEIQEHQRDSNQDFQTAFQKITERANHEIGAALRKRDAPEPAGHERENQDEETQTHMGQEPPD